MTAPAIQDPRYDMHLHCRFDMGGEELYAVKWYKDDHEFFRYTPSGPGTISYPVAGVHVNPNRSECDKSSCDLLLTNIRRPESSGAYRCEVSSEAPAFRLASQTHNVTVAALPEKAPIMEGLSGSYTLGDTLSATCTSDFGDPKPTLTFYINKKPVSLDYIKVLNSDSNYQHPYQGNSYLLKNTRIQLRMKIGKSMSVNARAEITCVSTTDGIGLAAAPSLRTSRNFSIIDPNQIVNNQKFSWTETISSGYHLKPGNLIVALPIVWRAINCFQM
ncbi:hypothetical protein GWI33_007422 [Rhynchophorus ferrugineus]|uniref:Ig-like domain-containing protein n=1 Tax=Rhynchophorus ferrugineus TaxID=354439 RepID=A0A834IG88_RHYFE|nr:hypothetical protein GWI33_007422 [Rhynchophorus ferrugineus]